MVYAIEVSSTGTITLTKVADEKFTRDSYAFAQTGSTGGPPEPTPTPTANGGNPVDQYAPLEANAVKFIAANIKAESAKWKGLTLSVQITDTHLMPHVVTVGDSLTPLSQANEVELQRLLDKASALFIERNKAQLPANLTAAEPTFDPSTGAPDPTPKSLPDTPAPTEAAPSPTPAMP
jgi:hypothetical protein